MLATEEQIRVVTETLENRKKSVEVIHALKDAGNVNEVGVKQTEAQQYATEVTLSDLKYNLRVLENSFNVLLNKKPGSVEKGSFIVITSYSIHYTKLYEYTAAHKKLKFGTQVRVTNPENKKSVIVTINDRGPFVSGREIDLTKRAFREIADNVITSYSIHYTKLYER